MLCHSLIVLLLIKSPSVSAKCCCFTLKSARWRVCVRACVCVRVCVCVCVCVCVWCRYCTGAGGISTTAGGGIDYVGERVTHPSKSTHTCTDTHLWRRCVCVCVCVCVWADCCSAVVRSLAAAAAAAELHHNTFSSSVRLCRAEHTWAAWLQQETRCDSLCFCLCVISALFLSEVLTSLTLTLSFFFFFCSFLPPAAKCLWVFWVEKCVIPKSVSRSKSPLLFFSLQKCLQIINTIRVTFNTLEVYMAP